MKNILTYLEEPNDLEQKKTTLLIYSKDSNKVTIKDNKLYILYAPADCGGTITINNKSYNLADYNGRIAIEETVTLFQFNNNPNVTYIDLSKLDTSLITTFNSILCNNRNLTKVKGIESLDTSNVTNMSYMFFNCSSLTTLDLSNFNTFNVVNMLSMFSGCSSLTSLDVSNFNTSNVENMSYMFCNCSSLTTLDVSNFDTSNVVTMYSMFSGCSSLTSLDVSSFNTSNVTNMGGMFYGCSSLTSLDVSNFDTSNVTNMSNMFYRCSSLTTVTGNIRNIKKSISFNASPLTNASAMVFINGLSNVSTTQKITFSKSTYQTLTPDQIAIATSKGWTVASA